MTSSVLGFNHIAFTIPWYGRTTSCLSLHELMGTGAVSTFCLLWLCCYEHLCTSLRVAQHTPGGERLAQTQPSPSHTLSRLCPGYKVLFLHILTRHSKLYFTVTLAIGENRKAFISTYNLLNCIQAKTFTPTISPKDRQEICLKTSKEVSIHGSIIIEVIHLCETC